jgi:predicted unusual protein kinase regulating ubiquinone biosynthesis (AarF/ABC1/UbiB family)
MRALVIVARLFPFVVAFTRDRRRFLLFGRGARRTEEEHRRRAERLAATLADLGPTFVKLAQVFAARADILPEPYLAAVGTLADQVPPLARGVAEAVIREELGEDVERIFDRFDPAPLAAASLGQVHRASYRDTEVVVKVLRPGVEEMVRQDLEISFRLLFVLNLLFPGHQVRAISSIVSEFAKRIADEVDFREEGRNAETLRRNFAGDSRVVVPAVIPELTRRRVLVLEYLSGDRIDRLHDRLATGEFTLGAIMTTIVDVYLKMMLEDGVFHADPHPGNLLVDAEGRLVLLDFGLVLRVEREMRQRLIATVLAAARQDVDGLINGFYALGILDPDVDRGTVRDAARQLMAVTLREDVSGRQIQRFVEDVLRTFYEWPLILPSDLVYFGRAAVLAEGIGHRYDPDFNAVAVARPAIARFAARAMGAGGIQETRARLVDWSQEAATAVRSLRELLRRVEREEFRIRWHPRDTMELQRFLAQQVRRGLLALLAFTIAVISALVWIGSRRLEILILGLLFSFGMFTVVFVLPSHLFQNPLRFRRRWPGR